MIKFFRKIRQQLLAESKFRRYLIYAFGEIILVVIGILIALQLNILNEARKEKQLEYRLLEEMIVEMKKNRELLEDSERTHNMHDSLLTRLLLAGPSLQPGDQARSLFATVYFRTTDFQSGAFKSIISEYGLSLISNDSLRNFVAAWEDKKNDINENEDIESRLVHERFFPTLQNYIPLKKVGSLFDTTKEERQKILADETFSQKMIALLEREDFQGLLIQRLFNEVGVIGEIEVLKEELKVAIRQAEAILNKND